MARNEQLIRQHRIMQVLERYRFGRTLEEIRDEVVDELGLTSLHIRSIRRDLEALQAAGIDVACHDSQRGRVWKLGPRFRGTHKIQASVTELISLSLGRDLLLPLSGTPFWHGIQSFWNKIRESLPAPVWSHYEKYRGVLHVLGTPAKSYERQQGILKTINRSILEHRIVEIEYQSIGQPQPSLRRIEPYGIVFYQSSLYIVAAYSAKVDEPASEPRHLKLDRFRRAAALDEWFKPDKDFDLNQHFGQSLGIFAGKKLQTFRIRISAYAAPWILEDPWQPDQQVKQHKGREHHLDGYAPIHELEVIPRVMALGMQAELVSPAAARRSLAKILRDRLQCYEQNG